MLTIHDPAGLAPDQSIRNLTLIPNLPTTIDPDLSRPVANGSELRRTKLGPGQVNDLVVDPASGNIVVAVGDEVDVLAGDGGLLARFMGLNGARSLSLDGGEVYVGLATQARIVRINLFTLTITGSWPLNRPTTGSIAAAGGKVWFVNGNDQWTTLGSLNPITGVITTIATPGSGDQYYVPLLRSVQGSSSCSPCPIRASRAIRRR